MKRIILLGIFIFCLINCKSQIGKKDAEYILNNAIELSKKDDIKKYFIIVSSMNIKDTAFYKNGSFGIGITIMDSKATYGLKYKKLYSYKGITVVSKDSLKIFKSLFSPIPYQNLNKSQIKELSYNPFNITLIFNKESKLLYTFPDDYENYFKDYKNSK
ncbi:hypothetical protein F3J23_20820 [Chryseobacterium sp. Tr-659]|uniref:hypothetical protein n=1 Tax=Chryseobacterium sp. Tr-659 TaxID=2608340 RepID=UPI0014230053|nr:hypothetical protein [Chryseobacterium sp. Tr-659]NIF07875.1 hypothetical protein [Chryseobacterium sp. Tr-659]